MRAKIIVFLIVFLALIFSHNYKNNKQIINNEITEEKQKSQNINISYNDEVINLNLEDYIIGVIACEMPASFHTESLKAMSVAARTFALNKLVNNKNYILNSTISDQCYIDKNKMHEKWNNDFDKYYNKIYDAVHSTENEVMTYNDEIIIAFYFSISNGYTENVENVFSQKLNYLVSKDSSWDQKYNYKEDNKIFSYDEFKKILNLTDIRESDISLDRSNTNRVNKITIQNKVYKGTEFRTLFNLKSTDFEIIFNDNNIHIKTKGYGHGVGMSQYGSHIMATEGYNYKEILKYYYNGIKIVNNY